MRRGGGGKEERGEGRRQQNERGKQAEGGERGPLKGNKGRGDKRRN